MSPLRKPPCLYDVNVLREVMLPGVGVNLIDQTGCLCPWPRVSPEHKNWYYEVVLWYEYVLVRNE